MRARLKELSQNERRIRSLRICHDLLALFSPRKSLALFAPMHIEPDLDLLWELGLDQFPLVSYPRFQGGTLLFHPVSALSELVPGQFGIREPVPGPSLAEMDLIVVPGLAFTSGGSRLGRGAGFYDRFLSTISKTTLKIGVCFEFQLASEIPQESHDVKMDTVVYA
jgi:5-formyltetrahydrofolate cyclo-ligase